MYSIAMIPNEVVILKGVGKHKPSLVITRRANVYSSGEKTCDVIDMITGEEIFDVRPKWLSTINQELN